MSEIPTMTTQDQIGDLAVNDLARGHVRPTARKGNEPSPARHIVSVDHVYGPNQDAVWAIPICGAPAGRLMTDALVSHPKPCRRCETLLVKRTQSSFRKCSSCGGQCMWADDAWVCRRCGDEWYPEHDPMYAEPGEAPT